MAESSHFDSTLHEADDEKSKAADEWFSTLKDTIHDRLFASRRDLQTVRVAIIGSGVDLSHPEIEEALNEKKIVECKGFPESLDPSHDEQGYGTHCVSVVLRTMPWVSIYIARVADDNGHLIEDNRYAGIVQAIAWAVESNVDIIAMPCGIKGEVTSVSVALAKANRAGIVLLAAGPNPGAWKLHPFHGRNVLGICSSDGYGQPSHTSLYFLQSWFSTLGEAVLGASPYLPKVVKGKQPMPYFARRSGTSVATCVAAGLAAMLIDYTRRYLNNQELNKIDGSRIEFLFNKMSESATQRYYRYVSPWCIFGPNQDIIGLMQDILKKPKLEAAVTPYAPPRHKTLLAKSSVESPLCLIPWDQDSNTRFVERKDVTLDGIRDSLIQHYRVTICGDSNTGKTELVRQFVRKSLESMTYRGIFWIDATSAESMRHGVYKLLNKMEAYPNQLELQPMKLMGELTSQDGFLLVFDNVEDVNIILPCLPPPMGLRHVLITTRSQELSITLGPPGRAFYLSQLDASESDALVSTIFEEYKIEVADGTIGELVKELGNFPQSIVVAATYIRETDQDVASYTTLCREFRKQFQDRLSIQDDSYLSVAIAVAISLQELKGTESIRLLCLLSFLSPDEIPLWIFTADSKFRDPTLRRIFSSQENLNNTLQPLYRLGLINHCRNTSISMDYFVQRVIRDIIEVNGMSNLIGINETPTYWIERAIDLLYVSSPTTMPARVTSPKVFESIYPHANQVLRIAEIYDIASIEMATLLSSTGLYFQGFDVLSAIRISRSAVKIVGRVFGVDHIRIAPFIDHVINALLALKKHDEAFKETAAALELVEKEFGMDNIALLENIFDHAGLCCHAKKFGEEIFHYRWGIKICEKAFGETHPKTRSAIFRLGDVYCCHGKYLEANREWERAVELFVGSAEETPIDVIITLNGIAQAYRAQGKLDEAIRQFQRVQQIQEKGWDKTDAEYRKTLQSLVNLFVQKANYDEALKCCNQLRRFDEQRDDDGIGLLSTNAMMSNVYHLQRNLPRLLEIHKEQLTIIESKFGVDYRMAYPLQGIGYVYERQRKYKEAIEQYEQSLAIGEKEGDAGIDVILSSLASISRVYIAQRKYNESLVVDLRSIEIGFRMPSPAYQITLAMVRASETLQNLGRFEEAMVHAQTAYSRAVSESGPESLSAAAQYEVIGSVFMLQGKYKSAMNYYENGVRIKELFFGKDTIDSTLSLFKIALLLYRWRKLDKSMQMCERILKIQGEGSHPDTARVLLQMGRMNEDLGRYEKALEQKNRALKIYENCEDSDPLDSAQMIAEIAMTYCWMGKYDKAMKEAQRSLEIRTEVCGDDHLEITISRELIGIVYSCEMEYDAAMKEYQQCLQIKNSVLGENNVYSVSIITRIGNVHDSQKNYTEALRCYQHALCISDAVYGMNSIESVHILGLMGISHDKLGDYENAMKYLTRALSIVESDGEGDELASTELIMDMGVIYMHQRKYDKAMGRLRYVLRVRESAFGVDHIKNVETIMYIGLAYQHQQRHAEAEEYLSRCRHILEQNLGYDHPRTRKLRMTIEEEMISHSKPTSTEELVSE